MSKAKSLVALAKSDDIQANVTRVFDLMGGVTNVIRKGTTVVLKPNAGHAEPPETSVCTNPEVVRAVIREVKKAEPKQIIVAEAAAIGCDTLECLKVSGIQAVCEEENVEMRDIKRDKDLVKVAVRGYRSNINCVKLPRFLLEADHLINLPILKAHASMVFSGALKNIKGVVQDKVHMDMHKQNLTMAMMDVWSVCRADINIMDAHRAASGYSPHMPVPIDTHMILGSKDPVAIDRVACEVTGIDTAGVDYFKVAEETGLGNYDMEQIDVVGDSIEDCFMKMWIPYIGDMSTRWPEYDVRCKGGCSSCQALLAINMEELKAVDAYDENAGMTVVIGGLNEIPAEIPDEKIVLHGNCTKKYLKEHPNAYHILGCPPNEPALYLTIQRHETIDGTGEQEDEIIRPCMARDAQVWRDYVFEKFEEYKKENPEAK
ncbi:Uncharacterized Fe-S center protein [uncultured Eubacterium sp.]|uniref:DUF362 domain-containing protein n=1 Tax=Emergencia sp. TaxID=1926557 RepID=UPI000821905D|nr:Uncharacterized Fe-S center protein [uncultured Eubacterium sp.]